MMTRLATTFGTPGSRPSDVSRSREVKEATLGSSCRRTSGMLDTSLATPTKSTSGGASPSRDLGLRSTAHSEGQATRWSSGTSARSLTPVICWHRPPNIWSLQEQQTIRRSSCEKRWGHTRALGSSKKHWGLASCFLPMKCQRGGTLRNRRGTRRKTIAEYEIGGIIPIAAKMVRSSPPRTSASPPRTSAVIPSLPPRPNKCGAGFANSPNLEENANGKAINKPPWSNFGAWATGLISRSEQRSGHAMMAPWRTSSSTPAPSTTT